MTATALLWQAGSALGALIVSSAVFVLASCVAWRQDMLWRAQRPEASLVTFDLAKSVQTACLCWGATSLGLYYDPLATVPLSAVGHYSVAPGTYLYVLGALAGQWIFLMGALESTFQRHRWQLRADGRLA